MMPDQALSTLIPAFLSGTPVSGFTHRFYRYPARLSPEFVRTVISAFTRPGDVVLDPFMGGGTTAVEALVANRRFIGTDLNPLSRFIVETKTTPLTTADVRTLQAWSERVAAIIYEQRKANTASTLTTRNVPWWLRRTIGFALDSIQGLTKRQSAFARCSLLRTAQWALDCRAKLPSSHDFLARHAANLTEMLESAEQFRLLAGPTSLIKTQRKLLTVSAAKLGKYRNTLKPWLPVRLVLTSPPYPGVHVLYHRWQVQGRRETPAPYWIAGCADGQGASYYTFGDRRRSSFAFYWQSLESCYRSIRKLLDPSSLVVQVVAFANADVHFPEFLATMRRAGFTALGAEPAERKVPNRKWYADLKGTLPSAREFLLIHRKDSNPDTEDL